MVENFEALLGQADVDSLPRHAFPPPQHPGQLRLGYFDDRLLIATGGARQALGQSVWQRVERPVLQ